MLKRFKAPLQFGTGIVHFLEAFRKAKYNSFIAASSFGNDPRILMILRSDMFNDSGTQSGAAFSWRAWSEPSLTDPEPYTY
jgi:hypothetical protein